MESSKFTDVVSLICIQVPPSWAPESAAVERIVSHKSVKKKSDKNLV